MISQENIMLYRYNSGDAQFFLAMIMKCYSLQFTGWDRRDSWDPWWHGNDDWHGQWSAGEGKGIQPGCWNCLLCMYLFS